MTGLDPFGPPKSVPDCNVFDKHRHYSIQEHSSYLLQTLGGEGWEGREIMDRNRAYLTLMIKHGKEKETSVGTSLNRSDRNIGKELRPRGVMIED